MPEPGRARVSEPMRIGYLECFAGISGDMLMGALVDAGAPVELLQRTAASLGLGAELSLTRVNRSGIQSTKIDVMVQGELHERTVSIQQGLEVGRGFMINYNLYRHYFPLMALSRARSRIEKRDRDIPMELIDASRLRSLAELGFVKNLPATDPRRRRSRGGIVARRLILKTAKLLARKSQKRFSL